MCLFSGLCSCYLLIYITSYPRPRTHSLSISSLVYYIHSMNLQLLSSITSIILLGSGSQTDYFPPKSQLFFYSQSMLPPPLQIPTFYSLALNPYGDDSLIYYY
ncbi:hypothetical protein BJX99DRAFT_71547 [Aspergillus californicus]